MSAQTFLQGVLSFMMSPYKRCIGRFTRNFFRRALKKAVNDSQKKLWITAGIAGEEFVKALLKLDSKISGEVLDQRLLRKNIDKNQILSVLQAYLSAIIVSISTYKEDVLKSTALTEQNFLQLWCWVFEYKQEEMKVFDELLLPAYHQYGSAGLIREIGKIIAYNFYQDTSELTQKETMILEDILLKDVSGILQYLKQSSKKE